MISDTPSIGFITKRYWMAVRPKEFSTEMISLPPERRSKPREICYRIHSKEDKSEMI